MSSTTCTEKEPLTDMWYNATHSLSVLKFCHFPYTEQQGLLLVSIITHAPSTLSIFLTRLWELGAVGLSRCPGLSVYFLDVMTRITEEKSYGDDMSWFWTAWSCIQESSFFFLSLFLLQCLLNLSAFLCKPPLSMSDTITEPSLKDLILFHSVMENSFLTDGTILLQASVEYWRIHNHTKTQVFRYYIPTSLLHKLSCPWFSKLHLQKLPDD